MLFGDHPTCALCGQIAGQDEPNAIQPIMRSRWSRRPVLAESVHAVVMPSIGALTSGHVLVCPKKHVRSVASADAEIRSEVAALAATTEQRLQRKCGLPVHTFEHGSSARGLTVACSVEHAHLHLVPADVDIRARLQVVVAWKPAAKCSKQILGGTGGDEYLLYGAPTGERWLATTKIGFASQLLRRVVADALGIGPQWNWRIHPARERMLATTELFLPAPATPAFPLEGVQC